MPASRYRGRRAFTIENTEVRVTVLVEGGHIAEIFDKLTGINPLWTPVWESVEPSAFAPQHHDVFGTGTDARLLAGIMGHNLCLDIFGAPSPEEFAAGLTAHGEGSLVTYEIESSTGTLVARARFPLAHLAFERRIDLHGRAVRIRERVENLVAVDRPIAWTQHVTFGPPFLEKGSTELRASASRSKVFETTFGAANYLEPGAEFDWPFAPRLDGGIADLRRVTDATPASAYTAQLLDPTRETACFVAFSPSTRLALAYVWKPRDFPWLGIWEESASRTASPWNGCSFTRGLEFGVSPFPETRRQMVERGSLFGVPTFLWIPAAGALGAEYWAVLQTANGPPESVAWPVPTAAL
jgi:hypothetical protein